MPSSTAPAQHLPDSRYAYMRLLVTMLLLTVGSGGMYVVAVVLPSVQAEFGIDRAQASMPYTALLVGFGVGGIWMGRLADRFGVMWPLLLGALCLGVGYVLSGLSGGIWGFTLAQGLLVGFLGSSAAFGPLMADTTQWFVRRRGIAVALCASGNYIAGAVWPPIIQHFVEVAGWRQTLIGLGVFTTLAMGALALMLRARPPAHDAHGMVAAHGQVPSDRPFGLSPGKAQGLLCVAGVACCVAMSMPQVHIVAYCTDLGFGAARGAQMLSLMLACGVVIRLVSGVI